MAYKNAVGNIDIEDAFEKLSADDTWGKHMKYASNAIGELGKVSVLWIYLKFIFTSFQILLYYLYSVC